jgi:TolB-like protein
MLLAITAAFAQEPEEARRLMVFFEVLSGTDLAEREQVLLYETLLINLSDSSDRIAVKEQEGQFVPPSDEEKNAIAEELEADSWLHVALSGSAGALKIEARSIDMLSGRTVYADTLEKELRRGIRDLQRQFWEEVTKPLAEYYSTAFSIDINSGTLVFEGLPGTQVRSSAWKKLKINTEGQVNVQVPLPATVPYRATKPGFFPIEGQIYMDQTTKVVPLKQQHGARIALDFYLNNMSYPGFDLTYFFLPDTVFGRISFLTYLIGFVLDDRSGESGSIFTSHTLNNISLAFGFYFNDPDRFFRPYFAIGAVWRIMTANGYWGLEPTAPFAVQPVLGCEYGRRQKIKVFAEYAPHFYWAPDRILFALTLPLDRDLAYLFFPPRDDVVDWAFAWEIFVFNVGVRVRL